MLSVHRGHSVRYLTDEVAKAREGYYTGAVTAGEPPGLWWGKGAETLGLSGEVNADLMEAVYTRLLDPRDPAVHDRETWDEAAPLAAGHRKYRTAEQVYAALLEAHPGAGPEERAALRAQAGRSARQAVSFIDVTFSAPKSVTVTGLAFERAGNDARTRGDHDAARAWDTHAKAVEDAMMAGTRAGLAYLQEHAGYSRVGHHGGGSGRWIDAHEFVVAQFFQHDSRERDPQWHIHNAILNRVLCADGVWRGVDGRAIDEHKAAAGAIAERVMEAHLAQSLGVRVETRPDGKAREVVGVDRDLMDLYSSRRAQITPKAAELIRAFTATRGREPSPYEKVVIYEEATLVTRKAKSHEGETREEQFARWEQMAHTRVTGGLTPLAERLLARGQDPGEPAEFSPLDVIERAVAEVAKTRAHYSHSDMVLAVCNALPGHLGVPPQDVEPLLLGLTDAALDLAQRLTPVEDLDALPDELRLANGESVYARHGSTRYATPGQLAAERSLIAAAVQRGAHRFTDDQVDAVCARFAESGTTLGPDQEAALRGVLTSGAQVEVLTAAAGTGKSFVVGAIADTWTTPSPANPVGSGGTPGGAAGVEGDSDGEPVRRVFGLAPYQNAAEVLAGEGVPTKNVRAWLATQNRIDRTRPGAMATGPNGDDEAWRLGRGDLVVIDEAGTAETGDLVAIHARCRQAGAKLLLVGDPRQLTAIGPGGALADIGEHGITYQLAEVRRFDNAWEGPASLRLRDGDPEVLAEYAKHGRLVDGGTAEQAEAAASRAWLADTLDGRESLLMVATNAAAARVSAGLRSELVRLGCVAEEGVPLGEGGDGSALAEWRGTVAGVGDLVQARALAWHLRGFETNTAAPITRRTYRVIGTRPDGGLTVAPIIDRQKPDTDTTSATDDSNTDDSAASDGTVGERNVWGELLGAPMQLPGSYVREHLSLGYASTKDAAQGRTVDTSHCVNGPGTDAAGLYVPATRGRERNTIYAITRHLAPDAETGETFDAATRTPEAVLADGLANVREDRSAHAEQAHAEDEARSVMTQIDRMADLIQEVNAGRVAATLDRLATTGHLTAHERGTLAADDAFDSLERLLRTAELAGHNPDQVLRAAIGARSLDGADSPAQVLHHRITHALSGQLTPRIRTGAADLIPHHLRGADTAADHRDAAAGGMDGKRAARLHQLADAADTRRHELGTQTAAQAPAWAVDALGPVPDSTDPTLVVARQDWEHRAGWAAAYRELVGYTDESDPLGNAPGKGRVEHAVLFRAAHESLALVDTGAEEANLSDGALRARVRAYDRELTWAPRWVDDELAATHQHHARATTDATVWAARADAPDTTPTEAARLRADATAARAEAARLAEQITQLEAADAARAAWFTHTAVTRDNAERSRVELKARGIDPDHPADQTTAPEWLALHRAEQADRERHQPISEHDIEDTDDRTDGWPAGHHDDQPARHENPEEDRTDRTDEPEPIEPELIETGVPDLRDVATPEVTETTDPTERRRVPTIDETTQAVQRAQASLAEIAQRHTADTARAQAAAADRDAAEAARREELNRWSTHDTTAQAGTDDTTGADTAGQEVLARDV